MKITAVIPFFNNFHETRDCVLSLKKSKEIDLRILLVDGKCTDDTPAKLKETFPDIEIIGGERERFWSGCTALGITEAINHGAEAVLFLNSDNEVLPDTIKRLADFLKSHPSAIGASKVLFKDSRRVSFAGRVHQWPLKAFGKIQFDDDSVPTEPFEAHVVDGQGVLMPISVFDKVEPPEEGLFPQYAGDNDFILRARAKGIRTWIDPDAVVLNQKPSGPDFVGSLSPVKQFLFRIRDIRSSLNLKIIWRFSSRHGGNPLIAVAYAFSLAAARSFTPGLLERAVNVYHKIIGKPPLNPKPALSAKQIVCLRPRPLKFDTKVKRLVKTLVCLGCDASILTLADDAPVPASVYDGIPATFFHLGSRKKVNAGWISKSFQYVEFTWKALGYIRKNKPRVVHCHDLETLPMGILAKMFFRCKIVYDSHELWTGYNNPAYIRFFYKTIERAILPYCSAVIFTTDGHADHAARLYKIPPPTIIWNAPNPITGNKKLDILDLLDPLEKERIVKGKYKKIIHVGFMHVNRGVDKLFEAMEFVPNAVLILLAPDSPSNKTYHKKAEAFSWGDRIFFAPSVPSNEVLPCLSSCDGGVIPLQNLNLHLYLNGPNKFFESLMAGLPVVVSDFPVMARFVRKYDIGEIVDEKSPQSIADGVNRLLQDKDRYNQIKANIKEFQKDFAWDRQAETLKKLYDKILQS